MKQDTSTQQFSVVSFLREVMRRRQRLPRLWKLPEVKLPQIDLPRVRVDFPEEVVVPWKEMEIERVEFAPP